MRSCASSFYCDLCTSRCGFVDVSLLLPVAPNGLAFVVPPSAVSFFWRLRWHFDWHNIRVIVATFSIAIHALGIMVVYWMLWPILQVFDRPFSFDVNFWIDGSSRTCSFRWSWQLHGFKSSNFFKLFGSSSVHRVM